MSIDKQDEGVQEFMRSEEQQKLTEQMRQAFDPEVLQQRINDRDNQIKTLEVTMGLKDEVIANQKKKIKHLINDLKIANDDCSGYDGCY